MKKLFLYRDQAEFEAFARSHASGAIVKLNGKAATFEDYDPSVYKEGFSGKELREKKFNTVEVAEFWGERHQFGYIRKSVNTLAGLGRLMNDLYIAAGYEDALVRSICIRNGWHFLLDVHYHKCDGRYFSKCAVAYDPVNMETLRYSGEYGFIVELGAPEWKKGRETWPVASSKAGRKKGGMARVADILNDLYYEQEDF